MDGFSYVNIFETKGIEYIIIIAFLILIIPFWLIINRQKEMKLLTIKTPGVLADILSRIPMGVFHSSNHTWVHLEHSGNAKIGLDDFLPNITGKINLIHVKLKDQHVRKGEVIAEIKQDGKMLRITSPVSGMITDINSLLSENPEVLNNDPYGRAWIYKIKPEKWSEETSSYFLAEEALAWSKREVVRFKDFLAVSLSKYSSANAQVALQDGGEIRDRPLSELPDEIWQDFEKSFLI